MDYDDYAIEGLVELLGAIVKESVGNITDMEVIAEGKHDCLERGHRCLLVT